MLNFREIKIEDKDWINELLNKSDFMGCEYSFANNMAWRRLNDSVITRYKDFYITGSIDGEFPVFNYPAGQGSIKEVINELNIYSNKLGHQLVLSSVTKESLQELLNIYGGENLVVKTDESYYDYIYNSDDLINLKGKKFHGKRNHIRRFKENNWSFHKLTEELFGECINFAVNSYNESKGYDDFSSICEQFAINTYFNHFDEFGLKGGVLKVNNEIVGFTIGERLNSNTFVVHIEKANADIQGSYPTICNEFAKMCAEDFKYINREEDLGIEGLRRSKKSYNPVFLLEKYTVYFKREV
ncbi:MAG: DUF2156 domain-containing protein [Clostridiales bacterium]|nr:DUF2156 domain-containing protein [Clostridiales bacterium]